MSQEEMDAALDALEADNGVTLGGLDEDQGEIETIKEAEVKGEAEPEVKEPAEESPPGYIGYEDWIASGKDPKKFRGEDAYTDQYNQIQENRETKAQLNTLNETMKHVAQAQEDWRNAEREKLRAEALAEQAQADEGGDLDGYKQAQAKLDSIQPPPPPPRQENPIIADFRQKNPMTDKSSPRFNADFNADVESFYNSMAHDLTLGGQRAMSDGQMNRCLTLAQKKASELNPELFTSQRNNRQTLKTTTKKSEKVSTDYRARLKGIGNARNSNDADAAVDMYDMLLKSGGEEAAKAFAKANLGD